jgi:tRNA(Arg) A34 adenosine deaminase TadA
MAARRIRNQDGPVDSWDDLDEPWQAAFGQAWEALRGGNIGVGACAATADGAIIRAARNRINDTSAPPGEVFGSSVAHAEINVLARLGFKQHQGLVLSTTLEPCLQCAGAIRLGRVGTVRFAGQDRYWDGFHDFARLSAREAARGRPRWEGPDRGEIGLFGLLIARTGLGDPRRDDGFDASLRSLGEGPVLDLAYQVDDSGELSRLLAADVSQAFAALRPRLSALAPGRSY